MQTCPCDSTIDRLWVLAVGAVLGGLITFVIGRVAGSHTRRDKARDKAAALCAHGLPLLDSLRDLHVAWTKADSQGAPSARLFWSTYPFLVAPASASEFLTMCREETPLSHQLLTSVLSAAQALEDLVAKHESVRQLLSAPTKAIHERTQYSHAFEHAVKALASAMVQLTAVAPSDTKKAVNSNSAIGAYRGNA
jgi:hypothetical protein